jgi:hypothetical protein
MGRLGEKVFEAWEGSETWSCHYAEEVVDLPGLWRRRFVALIQLSLGRLLLSRACFCFTGQIGLFPVSVSLGLYRKQELGKRLEGWNERSAGDRLRPSSEAIAFFLTEDLQGLAKGGGA